MTTLSAETVDVFGGGDNLRNNLEYGSVSDERLEELLLEENMGRSTSGDADEGYDNGSLTSGVKETDNDSTEEISKAGTRERSSLYQQGEEMRKAGNLDKALECFLASLTGLNENNSFHELPQCLHEISNIYFEKNEYEKAVYFIQAEKMYYETALIDIVTFQRQMREKRKNQLDDNSDTQSQQSVELTEKEISTFPNITKAMELENLAKLCLKEKKLQLAMEYCGKATKMYRESLGDDHPKTVATLDLFTSVYADVGKKLYEDAMKKYDVEEPPQTGAPTKHENENSSSGLRNRFTSKTEQSDPEEVFHQARTDPSVEFEPPPASADQDDYITTVLLMILFFLFTLLVGLLGSYLFCYFKDRSAFCAELKGDMTYWYMKMRHLYQYYIRGYRR